MRIVTDRLDSVLTERSFRRVKHIWNRESENVIDAVDLQISKGRETFAINLGVVDPSVHHRCWGESVPSPVDSSFCTVSIRLGVLYAERDIWWPISDAGADEAAEALATVGLPFIEEMHSKDAMRRQLEHEGVAKRDYPLPILILALLRDDTGDHSGACSLIEALRSRGLKTWQERIDSVSHAILC